MAPPVVRKKPTGRATVREPSEGPSQSPPARQESSEPPLTTESALDPLVDLGLGATTQTLLQSTGNTTPIVDLRSQINQSLTNELGTTINLSEKQFRTLVNQFRTVGLDQPVPTTEERILGTARGSGQSG
jgi:hypothetical protein